VTPSSAAQRADVGFRLPHRRLGRSQLRRRHRVGPPAVAAARPRGGQPRFRAFHDQLALELRQGGENPEHQFARRGGGIDRRAVAGQHFEADAALSQIVDEINQMAQIAAQPIQFPHHQDIPFA
jgi:hypothetical protein